MFIASYERTMAGAIPAKAPAPYRPDTLFPVPSKVQRHQAIIARVAAWHGLTKEDILGASRKDPIVNARHDAMVAVHLAYPMITYSALGRLFKRDRTTVYYALQKRGAI